MCNLYKVRHSAAEIAKLFNAGVGQFGNAGGEIYPGYPAPVIAESVVRQMTWGFPLALKGKGGQPLKPKPVNNTRSDKLHTGFWRSSFEARRCLIPMESFAEAEGPKGGKTRTWFSVPGQPVLAVAGIWRDTAEWGPAYSMVMTDEGPGLRGIHDRMPLILEPDEWALWTNSIPDDALGLTAPYRGTLDIERTTERWFKRVEDSAAEPGFSGI